MVRQGSQDGLDTGVLWSDDVAALWSTEGDHEVAPATVWSYLNKSKPADPKTGRKAGRYAEDPVPTPAGYKGGRPFWQRDQIPDLLAWRMRHPRGGDRRSAAYRRAHGRS